MQSEDSVVLQQSYVSKVSPLHRRAQCTHKEVLPCPLSTLLGLAPHGLALNRTYLFLHSTLANAVSACQDSSASLVSGGTFQ